jgi:hypothetical protein
MPVRALARITLALSICTTGIHGGSIAAAELRIEALPFVVTPECASGVLLSGDGTTVVGVLEGGVAARWRRGHALEVLGEACPTGIGRYGEACAASGAGSAVIWQPDGAVSIIDPPPGYSGFFPLSVDTPYVSGYLTGPQGRLAVTHGPPDGFRLVPGLPPSRDSYASEVSSLGVVAGWVFPDAGVPAPKRVGFKHILPSWTQVLTGPSGEAAWIAAISRYGNFVVGMYPIPGDPFPFVVGIAHQACLWAGAPTPVPLRPLPGTRRSDARDVSEWAEVIVGTCKDPDAPYRATAWFGWNRPVDLRRHLECHGLGAQLPELACAISVSDDGRSILCLEGGGPSVRTYLITGFAPPAGPVVDLNWDGHIDGLDLGLLLSDWGPCPSPCESDLDSDGAVDGADLAQLLARWGSCAF